MISEFKLEIIRLPYLEDHAKLAPPWTPRLEIYAAFMRATDIEFKDDEYEEPNDFIEFITYTSLKNVQQAKFMPHQLSLADTTACKY